MNEQEILGADAAANVLSDVDAAVGVAAVIANLWNADIESNKRQPSI